MALIFSAENAYSKIQLLEDIMLKINPTQNTQTNTKLETKKRNKTFNTNEASLLKRIHEENEKLNKLIKEQSYGPIIWDGTRKIETTKTLKGLLLNSIVSTNLESPLLVQVFRDQGI